MKSLRIPYSKEYTRRYKLDITSRKGSSKKAKSISYSRKKCVTLHKIHKKYTKYKSCKNRSSNSTRKRR